VDLSNPSSMLVWQRPEQRTKEQFARGSIGLKIYRGEAFQIIEFLETELADVEVTSEIRQRLDERIREGLKEVGT